MPPMAPTSKPKIRVLIVDDEETIRQVLSEFFKTFNHGYNYVVESAANGAEGVMLALRSSPDLVLLDMRMPMMDGLQVLKQLRAINLTMPVLVITASRDSKVAAEVLNQGVFAFIPKPFDFVQVDHIVALALSSGRRPAALSRA